MNCFDAMADVDAYLRGSLGPERSVEFGYHWVHCASCRQYLTQRLGGGRIAQTLETESGDHAWTPEQHSAHDEQLGVPA